MIVSTTAKMTGAMYVFDIVYLSTLRLFCRCCCLVLLGEIKAFVYMQIFFFYYCIYFIYITVIYLQNFNVNIYIYLFLKGIEKYELWKLYFKLNCVDYMHIYTNLKYHYDIIHHSVLC